MGPGEGDGLPMPIIPGPRTGHVSHVWASCASTSMHLAVLSPAEGGVLAVLAGTERPLSGREVARIGGQPRSTVAHVLRRLVEHGVVEAREAGGGAVLLYRLNREHLASEPLEALITLRRRLIERIRDELAMWSLRPCHASLFGSAARHPERRRPLPGASHERAGR